MCFKTEGVKGAFVFSRSEGVLGCIRQVLGHLDKTIHRIWQEASVRGLGREWEAYRQLRLVVENMEKMYMGLALEKTDEAVKCRFFEVEKIIHELSDVSQVESLVGRINRMVEDLPHIDGAPFVMQILPGCIVSSDKDFNVVIEAKGHFPKADKGSPALCFQQKRYMPSMRSGSSLIFSIPFSVLFPNRFGSAIESDKFSLEAFQIEVPSSEMRAYTGFVGVLPIHVGSVGVEHSISETRRISKQLSSKIYKQKAPSRGENADIIKTEYRLTPDDGYKFDVRTAKFQWISVQGCLRNEIVYSSPNGLIFAVSTYMVPGPRFLSGKVKFRLSCVEHKDEVITKKVARMVQLKWGDELPIENMSDFKIVYAPCGGEIVEITETSSHPFIKLVNVAGKLMLRVSDAHSLCPSLASPMKARL
ncbi:MAG: hypothetical protein ABSA17_08215 [Rhabdochlamydiaceae bacterium]